MSPDTGLMSNLSDAQGKAITNILSKHNRKDNETNRMIAATQIVAYCNIYGGKAGDHADDPIDGIPGLQN